MIDRDLAEDAVKPRVMMFIDTYVVGGAGKVLLQFLQHGGTNFCDPIVARFWRGPAASWDFRDAVEKLAVRFEVLQQQFAFDPSVIQAARRIAQTSNVQILESHGYKGHVVCIALKKWLGLPWIAYIHGWTSENLKVALYNSIDRNIVRFADHIIPVSQSLGARLPMGRKARERIIVINNAADLMQHPAGGSLDARGTLNVLNGDTLVGVVGRLSPEKGHRYFVEAMRRLSPDLRVKAVFIGDGPEKENLRRAIARFGLSDRVVLAGFQRDVAPFYAACDVVALPSVAEGMPNAALEAMSFGKPVIASNVGGIPEVIVHGETGFLVPPRNPDALAATLKRLALNPDERRKLGAAGSDRVKRSFDPTERAKTVGNLYRQMMQS